ncbi:hypothetical protein PZH44_14875, partial [Alistipes putredinis]|uniref:hypothetical protein n=1 Tax=Alistipes putredinis TaxID=28117 RepID=UPI0023B03AC4
RRNRAVPEGYRKQWHKDTKPGRYFNLSGRITASRSLFRGRFLIAIFTERPNYFVFLRPVEIVDP